ncbi:tRNA guanylyltransferase [Erysiphe neolycopersici]|uniref:tRNA guanylyltransferase n=1 Tax=Erysiphe neolycopersici TaxID=212602 RepID=A0A420I5I5_9PEZI|nr:tRNA guanylyltransferase [Erysiphe neolycopersici]
MNNAAKAVMTDIPDIVMSYGVSDEYRLLMKGHINNLYNTTFWALIQLGGLDAKSAEKELAGTLAADKHEILFSRFRINYNKEPEIYKKGSIIIYDCKSESLETTKDNIVSKSPPKNHSKRKEKCRITILHLDLIKDDFWESRKWILDCNG